MKTPQFLVTLAAVGTVGILLSGCVQTGPASSPSTVVTSSNPKPVTTSTPVGRPTSIDAAWAEANKAIDSFTRIQYEIENDGGTGVDRINTIAANDALTSTQKIASDLQSGGLRIVGGAPGWAPNVAASSFGTVIDSGGTKIPNGIVYARGCWDLSKQTSVAKTGTPPPDRSVKIFPIQFNVTYFPAEQTWKVTGQTNITGQSGAPQC